MRNRIALVISICLIWSTIGPTAYGFNQVQAASPLEAQIEKTAGYIQKTVKTPTIASAGGEWSIIALARSGADIPQSYFDAYYKRVVNELKKNYGVLSSSKYTEYSRVILALTAIGKDPRNIDGYNLVNRLNEFDKVKAQGVNGPAYALLAADSYAYGIDTREAYLKEILAREYTGGGFAIGGTDADLDITAMVLQALSNYCDRSNVKQVIDRGVNYINKSSPTGAEGIAQTIIVYTLLDINPKANVEELLKYANSDGGFSHLIGGKSDLIATEQSMIALVAYDRYLKGLTTIYDMTDKVNGITVILNGKFIAFDQKPESKNSRVMVPIRAVAEAMGADVGWGKVDGKISVKISDAAYSIEFIVGDKTALVNGDKVTFDQEAFIKNGRTLVPLRFVAEAFDAQVEWVQSLQRVVIEK